MKNLWAKLRGLRAWLITSCILLVVLLVANILCFGFLKSAVVWLLGDDTPYVKSGDASGLKYFEATSESKKDAYEKGNEFNIKLCEEGFTLLKNDGALPLAANAKVSVFGKNSVNLVYGGSGSGAGNTAGAKTLYDSLTSAGIAFNTELKTFYEGSKSGSGRPSNPSLDSGKEDGISSGETPISSLQGQSAIEATYGNYNDAALVVISRIGGESFDLPRQNVKGHADSSEHYLELDDNEKALLEYVCGKFDNVIVLLNSSTTMELGFLNDVKYNGKIKGCLMIGSPGFSGIMALGKILMGEVNPSGRTVDTFAVDFTANPTWMNFGDNLAKDGDRYNVGGKNRPYYYVDYEEGIYVGYRYYETRFGADDVEYAKQVVFPFGFGLSYTTFDWEVTDKSAINGVTLSDSDKNTDYTVKVKVTNTGSRAGKEVVQLYCNAPYTANGIEKSQSVLCGFAKTDLIKPGESDTVEITFNPYSVASYDYADKNGNSHKGYELEGGEYTLLVNRNAHNGTVNGVTGNVDSITFSVQASGIKYAADPDTNVSVVNRFDDADDELDMLLSRTDWTGTWPTRSQGHTVTDEFINRLKSTQTNNPNSYNTKPGTGKATELKLYDLIGKAYNDDMWNELLDSLTFNDMKTLFENGAFKTSAISSIDAPLTVDSDGPVGFTAFMGQNTVYDTVAYASEVVIASTWNVDLLYGLGESVGEEGIWGDQQDTGLPYSGWYAPGANIHRSPFGGRNFEYFSEDGFLSGMMAASEIKGAASKGVYCFIKHFALNEQETHRDSNGDCTWVTEQAMREIYLKPFEMAVKDGKAHGVMSSFNRIGTVWTGGDYRLLTEVLRGEWGFNGTVISDFNTHSYMDCKQMAYAGGDLNLTTTIFWDSASADNAGDVTALRNAAHNILYTVANSNAMNGHGEGVVYGYRMALWKVMFIVGDCLVVAGIAAWGGIAFYLKKKKSKIEE